jgi:hypothetical protein
MLTRILPLLAVVAIAAPAAALADDGGKTSGARAPGAKLAKVEHRIDARFQKFAAKCLVANAPAKCAHAAARIVHRLDRLQTRIDKLEGKIRERCSQAHAPTSCAHSADALARLDALKSKLAGYESQIKARYPA